MTNKEFDKLFRDIMLPNILRTRQSGGQEYARDEENIFANFQRISDSLDISVEECILVYAMKHLDGIIAHVQGTTSQREDVRGRITDLIVYMCLMWAYLVKDESFEEDKVAEKIREDNKAMDKSLINERVKVGPLVREKMDNAPDISSFKWEQDATNIPSWDGDLNNMPDDLQIVKKTAKQQPINSDGSARGCCGGNVKTGKNGYKENLEKIQKEEKE